jgi:hypothetical protein
LMHLIILSYSKYRDYAQNIVLSRICPSTRISTHFPRRATVSSESSYRPGFSDESASLMNTASSAGQFTKARPIQCPFTAARSIRADALYSLSHWLPSDDDLQSSR